MLVQKLCNLLILYLFMKTSLIVALSLLTLASVYVGYSHFKNTEVNDLECGLSSHFLNWINENGFASFNFNRPDINCAAQGGKSSDSDTISKIPVIFIHGNSDIGFGQGGTSPTYPQTGFRKLATYLAGQGWSKNSLYTTTWGAGNPNNVSNVYHAKEYVMYMRKFVEAVINYTQAPQVVVIGHSMGVTLGRRVVKGGKATDRHGSYDVGASLKSKIKTFIGLAGANLGLTACMGGGSISTCNAVDGFNPGSSAAAGPSTFMKEMNSDGIAEADKVYTIWGQFDTTIGIGGLVWGKVTPRINDQIGEIKKTTADFNHFALRDNTGPDLLGWL